MLGRYEPLPGINCWGACNAVGSARVWDFSASSYNTIPWPLSAGKPDAGQELHHRAGASKFRCWRNVTGYHST